MSPERISGQINGIINTLNYTFDVTSLRIHEKIRSLRFDLERALHSPSSRQLEIANRVEMPMRDRCSVEEWFAEVSERPDAEEIISASLKVEPELLRYIFSDICLNLRLKGSILNALKNSHHLDEFLICPVIEHPYAEEIYDIVARNMCSVSKFVDMFGIVKDQSYANKMRQIILARLSPESVLSLYVEYAEDGERVALRCGKKGLNDPLSFFTDEVIKGAIEQAPDRARELGLVCDAPLDI